MKKILNGEIIEMSNDEIKKWENYTNDKMEEVYTTEEKIKSLEEALELLLSGATE